MEVEGGTRRGGGSGICGKGVLYETRIILKMNRIGLKMSV